MRRIGKITGRSDDMLIIRGVNVFPTQIEEILLRNANLSAHYQLSSRASSISTNSTCASNCSPKCRTKSKGQRDAIGRDVAHHIKALVGVSAKIDVVHPGKIERTIVGKAKRVIDNRPK